MAQDKLQVGLEFDVQGTPTEKLEKDIKKAVSATDKLEDSAVKAKKGFGNLGDTIKGNEIAFGTLGVAGGVALAKLTEGVKDSVLEFASFQDIMLQVQSGTGSTDEEMKQLDPSSFELRRILKEVEDSMGKGSTHEKIFDVSGNRVGEWSLTDD